MSDLSIAASSSALSQVNQSPWAQRKSAFEQLGQALQSGDLSAAQQAFSTLQQNVPQGASAQNSQGNASQSQFAALGQALQSGNLSAAQQAFSKIQQAGGHHRHHHHASQDNANGSVTAAAPTTGATATTAVPDTNGTGVNLTA